MIGLEIRILALAGLFTAEALVATVQLDGAAPVPNGAWLTQLVHLWGASVARDLIGFAAIFATFAYLRYQPKLAQISSQVAEASVNRGLLAAHAVAIAVFAALSVVVYGGSWPALITDLAAAAWLASAAAAIVCAALSVLPWRLWVDVVHRTGWLWAWSAVASTAACAATASVRSLWRPASRLTFWLVESMARPFFPQLVVHRELLSIGTPRFSVEIADQCSGLEGIGLLLVFGVFWLILFRDELRFPRALLLLPVAIALLFLLNSVRILALFAIGNAGAREIATGGFHSQAGWLAFNTVALGLCISARRLSWISLRPPAEEPVVTRDSTGALLLPFLCVLAAGMISGAATGRFEWAYSLRVAAAAGALWLFRRNYGKLDFRFGWLAPAAGVVVFALWVALDRMAGARAAPMPAELAAAPETVRLLWIALRVLGAVVTVPIVEELAFRGFLMRRLIAADFESVSFRRFTWFSLGVSSLVFGLMHGGRWLPGSLAGLVFGLVLLRRGRIGDAIVAHATTNALLVVYVLALRQWQFW